MTSKSAMVYMATILLPVLAATFSDAIAQKTEVDTSAQPMGEMGTMSGMETDKAESVSSVSSLPEVRSGSFGLNEMTTSDMEDNVKQLMVYIDQLEVANGGDGSGRAWDMQAWYGTDLNKLWIRSEGKDYSNHDTEGDIEAVWSHATSAFWNAQWGIRQDTGYAAHRTWAAIGLQGTAPYLFDVQATAYVSRSDATGFRLRIDHDMRLTQHWVLQPEFEANAYSNTGGDAAYRLRIHPVFKRGCVYVTT